MNEEALKNRIEQLAECIIATRRGLAAALHLQVGDSTTELPALSSLVLQVDTLYAALQKSRKECEGWVRECVNDSYEKSLAVQQERERILAFVKEKTPGTYEELKNALGC